MQVLIKPVFLIGAMRSGTTLLAELLGEARQIVHCPFELKDIWSRVGGVEMASPKTRDAYCYELDAKDIQPGQRDKLTAAFIEKMVASRNDMPANAVFLNKNPHLCNKLPLVDALFPDARFIWIYRRLPSVVASLVSLFEKSKVRQQTWHYWPEPQNATTNRCWQAFHFALPEGIDMSRCFPGGNVRYLAEYWLESNRAVADFFKHLPSERRFIMQEEALIESPGEELASCLAFLGQAIPIRTDLAAAIDTKRNNVWGQQLTDHDLQKLLEFVNDHRQTISDIIPDKTQAEAYVREIGDVLASRNCTDFKVLKSNLPGLSLANRLIVRLARILSLGKRSQ